jgi:multiple sugar transport system permease protein
MVVGIWKGAPYDMMIFLAGLAGVDRVLYEAAAVDGASMWRRLWHVTFPALRPVFAILLTLAAIRGLRTFTEVFLLTNGGPNGSSEVMMTLIYKLGLERSGELGVASAGSVVLLAATAALTILVQVLRRRGAHR